MRAVRHRAVWLQEGPLVFNHPVFYSYCYSSLVLQPNVHDFNTCPYRPNHLECVLLYPMIPLIAVLPNMSYCASTPTSSRHQLGPLVYNHLVTVTASFGLIQTTSWRHHPNTGFPTSERQLLDSSLNFSATSYGPSRLHLGSHPGDVPQKRPSEIFSPILCGVHETPQRYLLVFPKRRSPHSSTCPETSFATFPAISRRHLLQFFPAISRRHISATSPAAPQFFLALVNYNSLWCGLAIFLKIRSPCLDRGGHTPHIVSYGLG